MVATFSTETRTRSVAKRSLHDADLSGIDSDEQGQSTGTKWSDIVKKNLARPPAIKAPCTNRTSDQERNIDDSIEEQTAVTQESGINSGAEQEMIKPTVAKWSDIASKGTTADLKAKETQAPTGSKEIPSLEEETNSTPKSQTDVHSPAVVEETVSTAGTKVPKTRKAKKQKKEHMDNADPKNENRETKRETKRDRKK